MHDPDVIGSSSRPAARWIAAVVALAVLAAGCGFSRSDVQDRAGSATDGGSARSSDSVTSDSAAGDSGRPDTGAAASDDTGATSSGAVPPGPNGYQAKLSDWKSCNGRYQCATLTVPLDWAKPSGDTIGLAVIRRRHEGRDPRIGSVVFNPGGPGGSGIDFLRHTLASDISNPLVKHFDLVSWDPRGVGASKGIRCFTDAELEAPDLDPAPTTLEGVQATEALARHHAQECVQKNGLDLLTNVGTRDTVRDLDALRAALGDAGLTYVGYSYGTTIGIEYASMFGPHIRAMVLDGVAIPGEDGITSSHQQGVAFEQALEQFFADCQKRGCPFGSDPKAALLAFQAKLHSGVRIPASYDYGGGLSRTATVGIGELDIALVQAMYDQSLWPILRQGLADAMDPAKPDGGTLLLLRDLYVGRQQDGSWDSILDANGVINCDDTTVRATSALGDPAARAKFDDLPILGPFIASGQPGCYLAPPAKDPLTLPKDGSITDTPPIVIVSSTGDPATPYENGVALTKIITHSVLVTGETTQHTSYGRGSSCLDGPVTTYLIEREVPKQGLRCKVS